MSRLYAVIMAGGSGTRFWPRSRRARPKQLLGFGSTTPLLVATCERLGELIPPERRLVITAAQHVEQVRALLPDVPAEQIVGEPQGRDTAACVGLAAQIVERLDPQGVAIAMPADHVLAPEDGYREHLAAAGAALDARPESVLVFGITPDRPATGYGYLQRGDSAGSFGGHEVFALRRFVEKPDRARAEELLAGGDHLWNAGLFAFRPATMTAAIAQHLPELAAGLAPLGQAWATPRFAAELQARYPALPRISIDYGVMERLQGALLLPLPLRWDDVGAWDALARLLLPDADGNVAEGPHLLLQSRNLIVAADGGLVAARGVEGLIIVHTPDATLVCRRDDAEGVKALTEELERRGLSRFS